MSHTGSSSNMNAPEDNGEAMEAEFNEAMEAEFNEVNEDDLNGIEQNNTTEIKSAENNVDDDNDDKEKDNESENEKADICDGESRLVMNNNFILPMESVETITSMEDESKSKKQKREKKDGRFYKFVKKHFLQRRNTSNDVQEIRIVPDGDEFKWARRSAGSAASRSSNETTSSEGDRLEVVHDMAEEYIPEV